MNLVQMLNMAVTPLSEWQPSCKPKKPRSGNPKPQHTKANVARTNKAKSRYIKAIGTDWASTAVVAARLGASPPSVCKTLAKYLAAGLLEQRPVGGAAGFNRRKGWEWRFKE